jgi:hypothetical protein
MIFTKYYLNLKKDSEFYYHRNMMNRFIDKYMKFYKKENNTEINLENAIIYSKFYFYYKIMDCGYDDEIMDVLLKVENS